MFKSKRTETEPFTEWTLTALAGSGEQYRVQGTIYAGADAGEAARYVTALQDGLRAAGFEAQLTLTARTTVLER